MDKYGNSGFYGLVTITSYAMYPESYIINITFILFRTATYVGGGDRTQVPTLLGAITKT